MSGPIHYRVAGPADRDRLTALFRAVYGDDYGRRTSSWRYLDRPWGRALIAVAEADGLLVGAQPSHEVPLRIDGRPVRGALLLDVMTHPACRRRGVFAGVVEHLRRLAHAEGMRVLLTTPNEAAARGFRRLDAWRCLGDLIPFVFTVDPAALVAGRSAWGALLRPLSWLRRRTLPADLRADAAGTGPGDDAAIDRPISSPWPEFAGAAPCMIAREPDFLAWRFPRVSLKDYRFIHGPRAERCEALAVTSPGVLMGRDVLLLVELMALKDTGAAADNVVRAVLRQGVRSRAAAVVGYFSPGSPLVPLLRRHGFHRVPGPLRPRAYTVWAATDLVGAPRDRALDLGAWHMTLADSDLA